MAEGKKAVVIYSDWIKKFEALEDGEAGRLIKHFFRYVNDLNPVAPDRITELSFIDIEASLKRDLKKWEERAERSRENGKSGGRPTAKIENPKEPEQTQQVILEPRKPDSVNVSVTDTVNVNDNVLLKKETKYNFKKELIDFGFKENLVDDWLKVRKTKKATNTETAFKKFIDQVKLSQKPINEILQTCVERSWSGFNNEWLEKEKSFAKKETTQTNFNQAKDFSQ
jgi:hypothetical protein